jgi:hypothetical protein
MSQEEAIEEVISISQEEALVEVSLMVTNIGLQINLKEKTSKEKLNRQSSVVNLEVVEVVIHLETQDLRQMIQ